MNLLKKQKQQDVEVVKQTKTQQQIKEIHGAFYSETQKLYESAQQMNDMKTQKQDVIDKAERLKKIGFQGTKEIKEAQEEIERLENKQKDNSQKQEIIEAINYFSVKYPHYKFITEASVKRICENHGLIYGTIDLYTGTVPDKNLKQLEEFQIKDEDKAYEEIDEFLSSMGVRTNKTNIDYQQYLRTEKRKKRLFPDEDVTGAQAELIMRCMELDRREYVQQAPLEIAASSKDFDLKQMDTKEFKIINKPIPDPVVLQPVMYNENKYYLVVTAWGDEAEDSEVLNEKHN